MRLRKYILPVIIVFLAGSFCFAWLGISRAQDKKSSAVAAVYVGMPLTDLFELYPRNKARTSRQDATEAAFTFDEPLEGPVKGLITFLIREAKVASWSKDDRPEVIREYLGEFCSQGIVQGGGKTFQAIRDVLGRVPYDVFLKITDRKRPVLFTEYYDSGTARFANTTEILPDPEDAPAFENGVTILKLSTALEGAETSLPIAGIVAHELAHRSLEHARKGAGACSMEREANRLIRKWGFTKEYAAASQSFGQKKFGNSASCQDR